MTGDQRALEDLIEFTSRKNLAKEIIKALEWLLRPSAACSMSVVNDLCQRQPLSRPKGKPNPPALAQIG